MILCFLLAAPEVFAQASSGIAGVVRDASGAVLPGVTVEAASPALIEKVRTGVTDGQGQFRIVGLVPGVYSVTFTLPASTRSSATASICRTTSRRPSTPSCESAASRKRSPVSGQSPVVDVSERVRPEPDHARGARYGSDQQDPRGVRRAHPRRDDGADHRPGRRRQQGRDLRPAAHPRHADRRQQDAARRVRDQRLQRPRVRAESGSAGEVSIELGNGPGEAPANGVYVNFVPRDGGNQFHGSTFGTYTGPGFQSEPKLTDDLISRGLSQGDLGKVIRIWDVNGSLGGPIVRDRLWFHHATRSWGSANAVVGAYYNADADGMDLRGRSIAAGQRRLQQLRHHQPVHAPGDGEAQVQCFVRLRVSVRLPPQRELDAGPGGVRAERLYYPKVLGITWNYPATNRLLFSAGTASNWMGYGPFPQIETPLDTISVVEQSNSLRYRSVGVNSTAASAGYGEKYNFIQASRFSAVVRHRLAQLQDRACSCGQGYKRYTAKGRRSNTRSETRSPVQLTMVAYPLTYSANMRAQMGLYAQDQWTLNRFTLNLGLRYDYQNSYVPEQHPARRTVHRRAQFRRGQLRAVLERLVAAGQLHLRRVRQRQDGRQGEHGTLRHGEHARDRGCRQPAGGANPSTNRAWTDSDRDFVPDCDLRNPAAERRVPAVLEPNFGRTVVTTRYDDSVLRDNRAASWASSLVVPARAASGDGAQRRLFPYELVELHHLSAFRQLERVAVRLQPLLRDAAARPRCRAAAATTCAASTTSIEQVRRYQQHSRDDVSDSTATSRKSTTGSTSP